MKKQILLFAVAILFSAQLFAQKQKSSGKTKELKFAMEPAYWEYDSTQVQFFKQRGVSAVKGKKGGYQIFLKDYIFSNGTIEYDVELTGRGFPGINFRMSDDKKNGENFYIRSFGAVSPLMRTTLQYAALMDGMSIWDLTDEYQAGATIYQEGWNHVKLVISGKQLKAYVNNMTSPALVVPALEGERDAGHISFSGNVIYANLVIKPDATEGLDPLPGYISTSNDTRYLRSWKVSAPIDFPFGKDLVMPLPGMYGTLNNSDLPDSTMQWADLKAETRAIVNLNRKFGAGEKDARRLAWIKTTIKSNKAQDKMLNLGFSDEVWVFVNGQILYIDKNYFGTPSQKFPSARCTIENTRFKVPLKEGDNEILIGIGNYFYGWGIIARFDDVDGIEIPK